MLEWLKKILYEEEEDIVEESELEAIDFSHVENEELSTIIEEQPVEQPVVEEVKVEKVPVVEVNEPKNNFNIQVSEQKEVEKEMAKPVRVRSIPDRKEKEIEVSAVISPIFGGPKIETPKETSQHVQKPLHAKQKKDALGTVISPMYGQNELEEHQKEVEEQAELKKTAVFIEADEEDEVPLEELIYNEEETDDCVQFSLFGDETKSSEIIDEE